MLFSTALFSSLLLSPVVLAAPSGQGARMARRGEGHQSQVNKRLENRVLTAVYYNPTWAGAMWTKDNGTFDVITGAFTVPTPSGPVGSSAAVLVGIDNGACTNAFLQVGIVMTVENGKPAYNASYEWAPAPRSPFSDPIEISAGDDIRLTVDVWTANSGAVAVENLTKGKLAFESLNSTAPLCGQSAEWIVEDYGSSPAALANFRNVMFVDANATGPSLKPYNPSGAIILDILQNNQTLTNVTTDGASVTIQYV